MYRSIPWVLPTLAISCTSLSVDLEGRACDPAGRCAAGYSCELPANRCIPWFQLGDPGSAGGGDLTTAGDRAGDVAPGDPGSGDVARGDSTLGDTIVGDTTVGDSATGDQRPPGDLVVCTGMWCPWSHRKPITILASQVAAPQTNFPILVDIAADAQLALRAQTSGDDIAFANAAGAQLDHEIEDWDAMTGRLLAWVEVDTLSAATDTVIYVYYGNGSAGPQQDPAGTWSSSYAGVWHLDEDAAGTGTANLYTDSTGNPNHGDDFITSNDKTGRIGAGQHFDVTNSDYIDCGNHTSLDPAQITISFWLYITNWGSNAGMVAKGGNANRQYWIWQWSMAGAHTIDSGGVTNSAWSLTTGGWHHVALTYDGANVQTYLDGLPAITTPQTTGPIDAQPESLLFGQIPGYVFLDGYMDEVRIASAPRTAQWILTQYRTQSNPASFYFLGVEE